MQILKYLTLFTFMLCLTAGCKKSNKNIDPCEGLLNESPPMRIGILVESKQSGENLILANGLTGADIKVSNLQTAVPQGNWRIIDSDMSPMNGMLELSVFHEKAGVYSYKVDLKNLPSITFSYTIKQEPTDNPCKKFSYPMENLQAVGNEFIPFKAAENTYPNIIKILLN